MNDDAPPGWLRRLLGVLRPHWRTIGVALLAAGAGQAVSALTPLVERHIIDNSIIAKRTPLAPWIAVLVLAGLVRFGAAYVRRYWAGRISLDVQHELRTRIFARLQSLDFARHDQLSTGQLVSRASSDIGLVQGLLAFLPIILANLLFFVVALVIMAELSVPLMLIALAVSPLLLVTSLKLRRVVFPANWHAQNEAGVVAGVVEEAVTGVRVVKGFGQERREVHKLAGAAEGLYGSRVRVVRLQARYQPLLQAIPAVGQVAVLALGGWLAIQGNISLGTFLAFSSYIAQLQSPARQLAGLISIGQQARAGVERVFEILDAEPLVTERPDATELAVDRGEVVLDDVSFAYAGGDPVLDHVSLRLAPGETVALVGASGSGKSTVSLLLPRFYDVTGGAVRIDGTDVRDVTLASLRRQVGVVFEDSFLFSDTLAENIAYGRPDASRDDIEAAARAAEADAFIRALPDGYDTVVGERGLTLSGGQRQRVALARALLTAPEVLILDDATSSIDSRVEREIHATMARVLGERTTLLVAHRRSTLSLADRVCVLDQGRVLDVGTYDELHARCPAFRLLLEGPGEIEDDTLDEDGAADPLAGRPATVETGIVDESMPAGPLAADPADDGPAGEGPAGGGPAGGGHGGDGSASDGALTDGQAADQVGAGGAAAAYRQRLALSGAGIGRMGGGGGRGGGGGAMSSALAGMPPTPELVERVEALPPIRDVPDMPIDEAARPDPRFRFVHFLRPWRRQLGLGLLLVTLDSLATLAGPAIISHGIDAGVTPKVDAVLWATSAVFLAVVTFDWLVSVAETLVTGRVAERVLYGLRIRVFSHLQRLSLDYYDRELGGRIMTRLTTDIEALTQLLQTGLVNAVVSLLTCLGVGVALFVMNPRLALITMAIAPPLAIGTVWFRRASGRAYDEARERIGTVNADFQESLSGVRVAQAYVRERRNTQRFAGLSSSYRVSRTRAQRMVATYFPFVEMLSEVAAAIVLGFGASLVTGGSLSRGELIAFLLYLDLFFTPIQQLSQVFDTYQQASVALDRIGGLLAEETLTPVAEHPVDPGPLEGRIELRDVRFTYPNTVEEALRGVDLVITPGETVAVVGETGAGKSTLEKLIARLYDVSGGQVLIDGHDVRDLDPAAFRSQLGVVPQEAFLFAGTVRDNLAYGRPDATADQIEAAARAVGAHDLVERLPGGYDHVVGEQGRSLSAGERQLLALARAELVDPAILLLDEATSNLDLATEARVGRAMSVVARHRTTVMIAHRLSTAATADRIVVMDGGRVVEDGSHQALLGAEGHYAALWAAYEPVVTA